MNTSNNMLSMNLIYSYGPRLNDELSTMVHKSRAHITNTLRLLQLSKKTLNALKEAKITAGHAKVLVGLSDKEQATLVASITGQKLTVREVEAMSKSMKSGDAPVAKKVKTESFDFDALKGRFNDLGFNVKTKSNEITLSFKSEADIEKLLERLY